jgi:hypothetical protein
VSDAGCSSGTLRLRRKIALSWREEFKNSLLRRINFKKGS